jgi:crossover junction endodeoxyribonuclease RuvC
VLSIRDFGYNAFMRVLSIDPGYGRCGVAVLDGDASNPKLIYSACIETSPTDPFALRIREVGNVIEKMIRDHTPECIAIEELFFTNNAKTALGVAEVRGVIIYIAAMHDIPIEEFNPSAIKIALTGEGRATKAQVTKMVQRLVRFPDNKVLDDEYDAVAVGITALAESRSRKR